MSNAVSARIDQLNMPLLRSSEKHGRRLDKTSQARKVREESSIAWSPGDGDPLALVDRLADHVAGALVPKGATKAMHMIVKLPDSVPVATRTDAIAAMNLAIEFAQETFGGNAVFAARIDRDERTLNNVDVFLAPRYEKVTKRASQQAVAMTRHLKLLAKKHKREADGGGARGEMISQGRALQDELAAWLTARGFEAVRGEPKATRGSDHLTPEEIGAKHDREAAEAALLDAQRVRDENADRLRQIDERERALRIKEIGAKHDREAAEAALLDAQTVSAETADRLRQIDERESALRIEEKEQRREGVRMEARKATVDRDREAVAKRETSIVEREEEVGRKANILDGLIAQLEQALAIVRRAQDLLAKAPEQVRLWLDPDRRVADTVKTAGPLVEQARKAAGTPVQGLAQRPALSPVDLAAQKAALDALRGRGGR